jgi:hypothetical protein
VCAPALEISRFQATVLLFCVFFSPSLLVFSPSPLFCNGNISLASANGLFDVFLILSAWEAWDYSVREVSLLDLFAALPSLIVWPSLILMSIALQPRRRFCPNAR